MNTEVVIPSERNKSFQLPSNWDALKVACLLELGPVPAAGTKTYNLTKERNRPLTIKSNKYSPAGAREQAEGVDYYNRVVGFFLQHATDGMSLLVAENHARFLKNHFYHWATNAQDNEDK
jgi:hypothetical protein